MYSHYHIYTTPTNDAKNEVGKYKLWKKRQVVSQYYYYLTFENVLPPMWPIILHGFTIINVHITYTLG